MTYLHFRFLRNSTSGDKATTTQQPPAMFSVAMRKALWLLYPWQNSFLVGYPFNLGGSTFLFDIVIFVQKPTHYVHYSFIM